ncbi:MAG: helix-turn-helix domain-containing protein, partial [Fulvivirga sp.]|uniref:helix-turn-helix domain-containing protein n=1 Tax=Fulvivirga sp. TaxID=1931237 RepID=UPI0032EFDD75
VNFIYFRGLSYPEIFNEYVARTKTQKYATSKTQEVDLAEKAHQIKQYMATEKPYLDFELNLSDLADRLEMNPRELSQLINDQLKMNFYEFVNTYRVEEAKQLLKKFSTSEKRINEVMYDSGFSSKSTFNEIFKRTTGMTPKEFRSHTQKK